MALKATIYKAVVNVADLDRNQFLDASLTLARHPSETQERMMLRLLAWVKYADDRLQFTRGLSAEDEPEAWLRNDHLGIDLWIELGLPDERRIKKRVRSQRKWRYLRIINVLRRFGGSRTRKNVRSLPISPSGIWMTSSWRN